MLNQLYIKENHVWKQDGTTYLDDVAIDILNESRQMIQIQNDIQTHEENDNLRKEVNDLKNKIINLQDELKVKTEQMTSLFMTLPSFKYGVATDNIQSCLVIPDSSTRWFKSSNSSSVTRKKTLFGLVLFMVSPLSFQFLLIFLK